MPLTIEIADEQSTSAHQQERLQQAVRSVLADAGIADGEVSVAIVDDARIHELNRQYLQHDFPTDVLSFVLEHDEHSCRLEGQIIASAEYAAREAVAYSWMADDELLLYVIHGALHLVGHDDHDPAGRQAMRNAEAKHLAQFGLKHQYDG